MLPKNKKEKHEQQEHDLMTYFDDLKYEGCEKVFVLLNFDDNKNIDVKVEEEKLKEYLDSLLLENSGQFLHLLDDT